VERTLLKPDFVDAIEQLKAQPGKDLIKYGTSRVDDTLLRAGLVDEVRLWVMPVVVGAGQRLFEDIDTSSLKLTLIDVRMPGNSSVILTYTPRDTPATKREPPQLVERQLEEARGLYEKRRAQPRPPA
jgi:dihydrofolate reductase